MDQHQRREVRPPWEPGIVVDAIVSPFTWGIVAWVLWAGGDFVLNAEHALVARWVGVVVVVASLALSMWRDR